MSQKLSLGKEKIKIVLFEGIHDRAAEVFASNGYTNVERLGKALTGQELVDKIKNAYMIGIRSRTQLTPEVLAAADKLMAVGCFCIGTNQVALEAAASKGIAVFNAPHSNTRSVAELVIGQTIMLMRGIFPKSMGAHRKDWKKSASGSHEVRGKTLGIVGYGHIGSQVSILGESMGMKVIYYDVQSRLPLGNAQAVDSLDTLLDRADVVTLHVPEDDTTKNMMDRATLEKMQKGAFLINASRGTVVEIEALAELLQSGHIAGAAVDVFPVEPKSNTQPFDSPLIGLDQVILTPHIGGSTMEAQENIGVEVANKLVSFSDIGTSVGAVNFPAVNLPPAKNAHRILHVHRNMPGMLRQVNDVIADRDINVLGQYLATTNQIGYLVFDIASDMPSSEILETLRNIEGTLRARLLY